jgi:hypothetical protein
MSSSSLPQPPGQSGHWLLPGGVEPEDINALASFSQAITHDGSTGCWGTVQCECPFNAAYDDVGEWEQRVYDCLWRQNGFPLEPPLDADVSPTSQLSSTATGDARGERGISNEGGPQAGGEDQQEGDVSDDEEHREGREDQEDEEGSETSEDNEDRTDGDYLEDGQEEVPATICACEEHDNSEEHENNERCKIANPPSDPNPEIEAVQSTGPVQLLPGQPDPGLIEYLTVAVCRGNRKRARAQYENQARIEVGISGSRPDTKASGAASTVPSARDVNTQERSLPLAPEMSSTHKFQGNSRPIQNTSTQYSTEVLRQKKRRSTFDEDGGSDAYQPAFKRVKSHEGPTSMLSTSRKNQSSAKSYPQSHSKGPFQGNPQGTSQGSSHGTPYLSTPHNTIDLSNERKRILDIQDEFDDDVDQRPIKKAKGTTTAPSPREANRAADKAPRKKGQSWSDEEGAALHQLVVEQQELEKRENLKPMRDERLFEKLAPQLQQRMGANGKSRSPLACKNYWNRIGRAKFNCENRGETKRSGTLVTSAQVTKAQKATQQGKIKQQTKQKSKAEAEESDADDYEE